MPGNDLKGRAGDDANALLAAVRYNFSLLLLRFEWFLGTLLVFVFRALTTPRLGPCSRNQQRSH
jgi:hypothetical protein